jgi:uncharacterized membrane protein YraQ (UPF0718 family)
MTTETLPAPLPLRRRLAAAARGADKVLLAIAAVLAALAIAAPGQFLPSLGFTAAALAKIAPWLLGSVLVAAAAKATGADAQVARVLSGRVSSAVVAAALFGALSPFCSCGVIPLIAGLLGAGVPLAPVMAFWLASPLMDPNQFALLIGAIGLPFALAKAGAAVAIGLLGGFGTIALMRMGAIAAPLREHLPQLTCCAKKRALAPPPPVWAFWREAERAQSFLLAAGQSGWFLLRLLTLAFLIESLMIAWVPGEVVARALGAENAFAIPVAVLLGVPAYLNGFAAIPLVSGLIELGMSPSVGLAFMLAGGVTSLPASMAVWALVRPPVFAAYLGFAAAGALAASYGFALML